MKRSVLLCLFIGLFALSTLSQGAEPEELTSKERIVIDALHAVHLDWSRLFPNWQFRFYTGKDGILGLSTHADQTIKIYIRTKHTPDRLAATMVHELAHAFDWVYMTPRMRQTWLEVRRLPATTPWLPDEGHSDFATGAGDFAESVSWTFQGPVGGFQSKLGPPPTQAQQELIRRWFAEAETDKE